MSSEDRLGLIMRMIRAGGILTVFLIALAGRPQLAFACEDYLITCSTAAACVAVIGNACGCDGEVHCAPGWDCEAPHDVATFCEEEGQS